MKRIKLFLEYNNSSRGSSLTKEEFSKILKENCKSWINDPKMFVRMKQRESDELSLIDPKGHTRVSISEYNHITMLMDNLPSWSDFPKRSQSVIFSYGMKNNPGAFGNHLHFVIPFDDANFGTSPAFDLWGVKNHDLLDYGLDDDFSIGLGKMGAPTNYDEFSKWANYKFSKENISDFESDIRGNYVTRSIFIKYKNEGGDLPFMEWFDNISDPSNWYPNSSNFSGEFKVVDYNQLDSIKSERGNECWTDSKCLVYYVGYIPTNHSESYYTPEFEKMIKSLSLPSSS